MSFLIKKKVEGKNLSIIFDIRSSSIGGSIVDFKENIPSVVYNTRTYKYFEKAPSSSAFVDVMLKTLNSVIRDIKEVGLVKVKKSGTLINLKDIHVTYTSPWYVSHIKDMKIKKEKSFKFSKDEFSKIVKEEISKTKDAKDQITIEKDITYVNVNGYHIENPFDKKVKDLDLSFYISSISKETVKEIEEMIEDSFEHVPDIIHRTHPLILFSTLRNIYKSTPNFIFIDIGGEVTDIGLVRNDRLVNTLNIPFGKHYFIRKVMEECKSDYVTAISSIRTISNEEIHKECRKKVVKILPDLTKEWLKNLEEAIKLFGDTPNIAFVTVDNDLKELFEKILKDKEFDFNNKESNILFIDQNSIKSEINIAPGVTDDIFMSLTGIFLKHTGY